MNHGSYARRVSRFGVTVFCWFRRIVEFVGLRSWRGVLLSSIVCSVRLCCPVTAG